MPEDQEDRIVDIVRRKGPIPVPQIKHDLEITELNMVQRVILRLLRERRVELTAKGIVALE